jgi:hypothetical protein
VSTVAPATEERAAQKQTILLLTSSLLVDRVFLHTAILEHLYQTANVVVWATSAGNGWPAELRSNGRRVEPFPEVQPFKEFPYNFLRRFNELVWDYRLRTPSRMSVRQHVRSKAENVKLRAMKAPARLVSLLGTERQLESAIERLLLSYPRSPEAAARLTEERPSVLVTTGPFQYEQPAVFSAARKLGIPTLAYIPSWDNISTKNRMLFRYDGYVVWNEQMKKELTEFYPQAAGKPIYTIGAPQFDVFRQAKFRRSKEEFCREQGLDPNLPIIVYAIGSPNFLQEHHGAVYFARRVAEGALGNVQLLVRPHPIHDNAEMKDLFSQFSRRVRLQASPNAGLALTERTQDEDQITEWVNTFRHADVVVNLSSTVTIDAAIFDKPVVNLDFDPQPGQADQELIKDVNHLWTHFKPIAESGGVWLVNDFDELESAVRAYLDDPSLHREQRKWIVDHVCGYADGRCGERMAAAILDFANITADRSRERLPDSTRPSPEISSAYR